MPMGGSDFDDVAGCWVDVPLLVVVGVEVTALR